MDEVDIQIEDILAPPRSDVSFADIVSQKEIPPKKTGFVKDKTTWNAWLDKIDFGLYPNVIVVMTSNKSPQEITSDDSILRKGRVHVMLNVDDVKASLGVNTKS